ncbi:uncharacterized protein [Narcine bancroftii]|uniref:uncharacterized protein n=1 Tax=Narcine bancroftii TaxID=1343680 RepID=UPI003831A686
MSCGTFHFMLELIEPHLKMHRPNLQRPLEPRLQLAVALWWYATPCEYQSISTIFGIGISTVCMVEQKVTAALRKFLDKRFISLPSGTRPQETIDGFAQRGYPMCAGAIDGSHILIIDPGWMLQPTTIAKGGIRWFIKQRLTTDSASNVFVGWPGHTHDARVLANSPLYRKADTSSHVSKDVEGVEVPAHLVGDAAYPLRNWLMKGFTQHLVLDQDQRRFSKALNSAGIVVEHAFAHLKGRWRCLSQLLDISTTLVLDVVFACYVLHNM